MRNSKKLMGERKYEKEERFVNPILPLVEIYGNQRILIEHHKGVCEYGEELIRVRIRQGCICINGKFLQISCITKERIVVQGQIGNVQYHLGESHEKRDW